MCVSIEYVREWYSDFSDYDRAYVFYRASARGLSAMCVAGLRGRELHDVQSVGRETQTSGRSYGGGQTNA